MASAYPDRTRSANPEWLRTSRQWAKITVATVGKGRAPAGSWDCMTLSFYGFVPIGVKTKMAPVAGLAERAFDE